MQTNAKPEQILAEASELSEANSAWVLDSTFLKTIIYQMNLVRKHGGNLEFYVEGGSVSFTQQCTYVLGKDFLTIVEVTGNTDTLPLSAIARCRYVR